MADGNWLDALNRECERTSQAETARRLGISKTTLNQVLRGTYKAGTRKLEARVRGELMREKVNCPVAGEITRRQCQDNQALPFAATNPQRVQLFVNCRKCEHRNVQGGRG